MLQIQTTDGLKTFFRLVFYSYEDHATDLQTENYSKIISQEISPEKDARKLWKQNYLMHFNYDRFVHVKYIYPVASCDEVKQFVLLLGNELISTKITQSGVSYSILKERDYIKSFDYKVLVINSNVKTPQSYILTLGIFDELIVKERLIYKLSILFPMKDDNHIAALSKGLFRYDPIKPRKFFSSDYL